MSMLVGTVGIVGGATRDSYLAQCETETDGNTVSVRCGAHSRRLKILDGCADAGGKATLSELPAGLLAHASRTEFGGGGVNSCRAFQMVAPGYPLRYLDVSLFDPQLSAYLNNPATRVRFLGLRPIPVNAVLGDRGDKVILKSPTPPGVTCLSLERQAEITWLASAKAILANSLRDPAVIARLIYESGRRRAKVYLGVTRSLPSDSGIESIASVIIAGWDDFSEQIALGVRMDISGGMLAVERLRELAPTAALFVTMGREGVLLQTASDCAAVHVRLRSGVDSQVQLLVFENPSRACGCGDAFAAGLFAELETGRSYLSNVRTERPRFERAAMSGCASALRWLGYRGPLAESDFVVATIHRRRSGKTLDVVLSKRLA